MSLSETELLERMRNAEITLTEELVGVVVDAELIQTSPDHPELLDAGRRQEAQRIDGKDDQKSFHMETNGWNKQNKFHQKYSSDATLNNFC